MLRTVSALVAALATAVAATTPAVATPPAATPAALATVKPWAAGDQWRTRAGLTPRPRSEVPWGQVRKGWVAFTVQQGDATTLYLASPQGQPYRIREVEEGWQVIDLRPDGRAAVLYRRGEDYPENRVVNLVTGSAHSPFITGSWVRFARPSGASLVGVGGDAGRFVERRAYDGTELLSRSLPVSYVIRPDDGATLIGQGPQRLPLDGATFAPGPAYVSPRGYTECSALGTWDASSFLQTCSRPLGRSRLFAQPVRGGRPEPVVHGALAKGLTWDTAWKTRAGTVASTRLPYGTQGATPSYLIAGRTKTPIPLPPGYDTGHELWGVDESRLYFAHRLATVQGARAQAGPAPSRSSGAATAAALLPPQAAGLTVVEPVARRVTRLAGEGSTIPGLVTSSVMLGSRQG